MEFEEFNLPICKTHTTCDDYGLVTHFLATGTNDKPFLLFVDDGKNQVFVVCKSREFSWFKFREIRKQYNLYFLNDDATNPEDLSDYKHGALVVSAAEFDQLVKKFFAINTVSTIGLVPSLESNVGLRIFGTVPEKVNEDVESLVGAVATESLYDRDLS